MTTAQDQQSRAEFETFWRKEMNVEAMDLARTNYPMTPPEKQQYLCHETNRAWITWQAARALPAPENVREGEPYDHPAFEELARTMGVWGTAQAALCAQFFLAGRALPARGVGPMLDTPAGMEPVAGQCRFIGEEKWKPCAAEHVRMVLADPRYAAEGYEVRYVYTAAQVQAMGRVPPGFKAVPVEPTGDMLVAIMSEGEVEVLRETPKKHQVLLIDRAGIPERYAALLAAAPRPPAAQEAPSYLEQMFGPGPTPRPPAAQEGA